MAETGLAKALPPPPPPKQPQSARAPSRITKPLRATTRHRGPTKKHFAAWWVAHRADIDALGGPVREPRTNVDVQFEQFRYRGDV